MADSYLTLDAPSGAIVREKMSRFMAFAHPVTSVDQAKDVISGYQNRYHDARHVCWAYMLGAARTDCQSNDNGEPSGTAGKPILGQINSFGLTDVVIVVVRYFGGIKLGTSGLIAAYRQAAKEAIEAGSIITLRQQTELTFTFSYMVMNDVMKLVKHPDIKIMHQDFDNSCSLTLRLPADTATQLLPRLKAVPSVTLS